MSKPNGVHLRAIQSPRNGRPTRRTRTAQTLLYLMNGRPSMRILRGWGFFRGLRRALTEVVAMAVVLALSIVLAHMMLIVLFPV